MSEIIRRAFCRLLVIVLIANPLLATADTAAPPLDLRALERQLHRQINDERQRCGVKALIFDERLADIARRHSEDMAMHRFFSHTNLQGETPSERAERQGWLPEKPLGPNTIAVGIAENIFLTQLYDKVYTLVENGRSVGREYAWLNGRQLVQSIVSGWLESAAHRNLMLSPQYDREGLGIAVSETAVYVTDDLF